MFSWSITGWIGRVEQNCRIQIKGLIENWFSDIEALEKLALLIDQALGIVVKVQPEVYKANWAHVII